MIPETLLILFYFSSSGVPSCDTLKPYLVKLSPASCPAEDSDTNVELLDAQGRDSPCFSP